MKPLKRHPALIELSREHHHALSLCVRLLRTPAESHQTELEAHFLELEPHSAESHQTELEAHFLELEPHFAEEEVMFAPYWQDIPSVMRERFEAEHAKLRGMMANPEYLNEEWNKDFAVTLRDHARFEERELFPAVEPFLPPPEGI